MDPSTRSSPENTVESKPPSSVSSLFVGPDGLRAGWRFVIYIVAVVGLMLALRYAFSPLFSKTHGGTPSLWMFLLWECGAFLVSVVPALVLSHYEKRRFDDYGLPHKEAFGRNFWIGALWGLVAITCLLVGLRLVGVFYFGGLAMHGIYALRFALFWAVMFTVVGLFEEFVSRGYSQFTLAQGMGFWPAAVLLSVVFGALHLNNKGEALIGALGAAAIALFFCLTLRRTGSLWFAVGLHGAWDWGETFLYSVPNSGISTTGHLMNPSLHGSRWLSGGSVGPEGSVLVFVLIAVMWVVFDRVYPAKTTSQPAS